MSVKRIFTSLCLAALAVFCLGNASNAMAQSVNGGGVWDVNNNGAPVSFAISARTGADGAEGHLMLGAKGDRVFATVVSLCVEGNQAIVQGVITRSNIAGLPEGAVLAFAVTDNGNSGDLLFPVVLPSVIPCTGFPPIGIPITGNVTVNP